MVQRITAKCGKGASALYRVRWKCYGAKDDQCLPRSSLGGALDRLAEFEASATAKNKAKTKAMLNKSSALRTRCSSAVPESCG